MNFRTVPDYLIPEGEKMENNRDIKTEFNSEPKKGTNYTMVCSPINIFGWLIFQGYCQQVSQEIGQQFMMFLTESLGGITTKASQVNTK